MLLCFAYVVTSAQVYTPVIANYTISGKPIGYSQATPSDGRSMFYDATNFIYRPYKDSQEVITYLNLPKYRAGNAIYFVDSGGTLNGNGTYTNLHVTYWTFQDGVADVNLIKLFLNGNASGGCPQCFQTTTQLTDSSFKLNRGNGTSDTVVIDVFPGIFLNTANNFLTATGTNVQAGGPLVKDTYANGGAHVFGINGNIFEMGSGAAISAAAVLTPGSDGNTFSVIGSTAINDISTTNIQSGTHVGFIFTGTPTLSYNVAGPAGSAPMLLAGSVNYTANTGDYIEFVYDLTSNAWHETARKLSGSGGVYTFSNGLTEFPATQVKLGGTLLNTTTISGNGHPLLITGGRFEQGMGLPVLAAGDLVTGNDGNFFQITGTTQINAINNQNWQAGSEISFYFNSIVTLKNNTAGGVNTSPMLLAGLLDYTSAVGDYIGFIFDGSFWRETNRKLAGSVSSGITTGNNGLTASTATNLQLGGSLIHGTTITQGANTLAFSGGVQGNMVSISNTIASGSGTYTALNTTTLTFGGANSITGIKSFASGANSGVNIGGQFEGDVGTGGGTLAYGVYAQSDAGIGVYGQSLQNIGVEGVLTSGTGGSAVKGDATATGGNGIFGITTTGKAVVGQATANGGIGLYGETDGTGGNSIGVFGLAAGGSNSYAGQFQVTDASTNTIIPNTKFIRASGGVAANGIGESLDIYIQNSDNSVNPSNQFISKWTDASIGTRTSLLSITGVNSGATVTKLSIGGNATFLGATRFELTKGANVASTGNLTLGTDGNVFHITGTTQINAITTADWQAGSELILIFDASLTVKNNTAGGAGTAVMLLAGGADFSATSNDVLTLIWDGTSFFEKCRSVN